MGGVLSVGTGSEIVAEALLAHLGRRYLMRLWRQMFTYKHHKPAPDTFPTVRPVDGVMPTQCI